MNNNNEEKNNTGDEIMKPKGFLGWLDNFWYHYKWHSIVALFLVVAVTICTVQMCQKESYDMYILYAGDHAFARQSVDADEPEYYKAKKNLSSFVTDYDGNGEVNISLRDLYVPSNDNMKDLEESYYQRAYEDRTTLSTLMVSGDHYLCFLSSEVYSNYKDTERLVDLTQYAPDGASVKYYDDTGMAIYLSSTEFGKLAGFSNLPEDTLICLRSMSFSNHITKKSNLESYERAAETLVKILSYGLN